MKLQERLAWSDVELLRSILAFLDTRSWVVEAVSSDDNEEFAVDDKVIKSERRSSLCTSTLDDNKHGRPSIGRLYS